MCALRGFGLSWVVSVGIGLGLLEGLGFKAGSNPTGEQFMINARKAYKEHLVNVRKAKSYEEWLMLWV